MLFNIAHFNALVALLAALSLPFAGAHPLDRDDNSSVSLEHSTNVSARADDEPPGYSATGDELPGYSEEPSEGSPPEYVVEAGPGLQKVKSIKIDEENMTATVNKGKVYRLASNPAELGVPDKNGLHRKYYMIDDTPEVGEEPVKMAVLKIVDLLKASKLDKSVPKILQEEGYFWGKFRYYIWDKTIKHSDKHKKLTKWEYHIAYVPLRNGLDLNDVEETEDGGQEPVLRELKYLHEWAIEQEWTPENVEERLAKCKATAIKTHEDFAARRFGINNISPKMWLTDADCEVWVPNQIDPSYEYVNPKTKAKITVRGAKKLKDDRAKDKYLTDVKHRMKEEVFTVSALQEQGYTYISMEQDIAAGNLDHYT